MTTISNVVERGNPDELLGLVNHLCTDEAWDDLVDLKHRCLEAVTRGKQLWGVAAHIDYRLALEAPGPWAAPVITEGAGRFTLGPLPEVTASTHLWGELDPYLPDGPARSVVAQERVVRGENLLHASVDPGILEIPLRLELWEPPYPLATYHPSKAEFPPPDLPPMRPVDLPRNPEIISDVLSTNALTELTTVWTEESNGRSEASAVAGTAADAIAALGLRAARIVQITPQSGVAVMAWAGASGGAHGRRPGAAAGRFAAWWTVSELAGLEWPPEPAELGEAVHRLAWYAWSDLFPPTGWTLHLAIEDPEEGLAWAVSAVDAA